MASKRGPNGEGSVFRCKDGRWAAELSLGYVDGKRKRKRVYGRTQQEALAERREMLRRIAEGRPPVDSSNPLSDWLIWWLDHEVEPSDLAERTKASYRSEVELHIAPALGRHRLANLRPQHITEWLSSMAKAAESDTRGRPSSNTRRIRFAILRRALTRAVDHGLLARSPCEAVPTPKARRNVATVHDLSLADAQALLAAAAAHRLKALWYLLVMVGLRKGEALGLRWSDLDLLRAEIRIEQILGRVKGKGLVFSAPKTDSSRRTLPVPPAALEALQQHWAAQEIERATSAEPWPAHDLIFTTSTGNPIEPSGLNRQFKVLCRQAGLPDERIHNLRHAAATIMRVHGGADLFEVSRLLGHSSIRVTADMYGHTVPAAQKDIADRMSDLLSGQVDSAS